MKTLKALRKTKKYNIFFIFYCFQEVICNKVFSSISSFCNPDDVCTKIQE